MVAEVKCNHKKTNRKSRAKSGGDPEICFLKSLERGTVRGVRLLSMSPSKKMSFDILRRRIELLETQCGSTNEPAKKVAASKAIGKK